MVQWSYRHLRNDIVNQMIEVREKVHLNIFLLLLANCITDTHETKLLFHSTYFIGTALTLNHITQVLVQWQHTTFITRQYTASVYHLTIQNKYKIWYWIFEALIICKEPYRDMLFLLDTIYTLRCYSLYDAIIHRPLSH